MAASKGKAPPHKGGRKKFTKKKEGKMDTQAKGKKKAMPKAKGKMGK